MMLPSRCAVRFDCLSADVTVNFSFSVNDMVLLQNKQLEQKLVSPQRMKQMATCCKIFLKWLHKACYLYPFIRETFL